MNAFLDTSVLVAAFLADHPHHPASLEVLSTFERDSGACGAHSIAEVYSALTRMPIRPAILPSQAHLYLQQITDPLSKICLEESDYSHVQDELVARGIAGPIIYDALLLRCAVKSEADTIYTWNLRDFQNLAPELKDRIRNPGQ